jgi:hypothetical protein
MSQKQMKISSLSFILSGSLLRPDIRKCDSEPGNQARRDEGRDFLGTRSDWSFVRSPSPFMFIAIYHRSLGECARDSSGKSLREPIGWSFHAQYRSFSFTRWVSSMAAMGCPQFWILLISRRPILRFRFDLASGNVEIMMMHWLKTLQLRGARDNDAEKCDADWHTKVKARLWNRICTKKTKTSAIRRTGR